MATLGANKTILCTSHNTPDPPLKPGMVVGTDPKKKPPKIKCQQIVGSRVKSQDPVIGA